MHSTKATQETTEDEDHVREGHRSMMHFKFSPNKHPLNMTKLNASEKVWENPTQHSVWTQEEVDEVKITHLQANDVSICVWERGGGMDGEEEGGAGGSDLLYIC